MLDSYTIEVPQNSSSVEITILYHRPENEA